MPVLSPVTITGTAADTDGGVVSRVEISADGGQTWQPATWGSDTANVSWSYTWTPTTTGSVTKLEIRAENGNAYVGPVQNLPLTVGPQQCPCSVFPATSAPVTADSGDSSAVTLGVKVTPTQPGYITGIRFYKSAANTGTHIGALWTSTGTQLATGTFTNETASGWQQLNFAQPVPVRANTTYVASYYRAQRALLRGRATTSPRTVLAWLRSSRRNPRIQRRVCLRVRDHIPESRATRAPITGSTWS